MTTSSDLVPPNSTRRWIGRAGQWACVVATAGLGVFVLKTFAEVVHGPDVSPPAVTEVTHEDLLPPDGWWQFAGSAVGSGQEVDLTDDEVVGWLERMPDATAPAGELTDALRTRVAGWAQTILPANAGTSYATAIPNAQMRMFTRSVRGREQWVCVRLATRSSDGWAGIELTPPADAPTRLPDGVRRLAVRTGPDGAVHAALVEWAGDADLFRFAAVGAGWKADGVDRWFTPDGRSTTVRVWASHGATTTALLAYPPPADKR